MNTPTFKARVQEILNFITEITLGTYTYTLPLRNQKDELEQIAISLNIMVEEINTVVHQINFEKSKEAIENVIINLDENLQITSFSENIRKILMYKEEHLLGKPLKLILGDRIGLNEQIEKFMTDVGQYRLPISIELKHHCGYSWSGYGYLHPLISGEQTGYCLSVFKAVYCNERLKNELKDRKEGQIRYPSEYRSLLLKDQRDLVRTLHAYIIKRLDRPLPKLSVIAREVGASVSKMTVIFKRTYEESINEYHLRKRLEKAYALIRDTSMSISEISEECGFVSLAHFSRSFKKHYSVAPSKIREL
ncbi:helix-turn-helix transcriptional regulator [Zunongwangia sp. SCSIO 43204]|uniref:AraC family transcriptional regulator n=1 Tax=Zunongwangia sp. SCSIO 43204 TaxID=2779359 RepID=UPI001CA9FE19|nr:AraC family transcriptional regulator [Zunongwangia sp. SCSIO 43204]UAB84171.1 helix-turn-helix transcriptional regulator [Zunongwangia sp. SCSIO 43204]